MNYDWSLDLPNRLGFLLNSGEWSDCSFVVGTEPDVKIFNAHRLLVSVASPVFRAMFNGDLAEKSPVKIVDIEPGIFQHVLDFIYTDEMRLDTMEDICDLWYAADKYLIPKLIDKCEQKILSMVDPSNVSQAYDIAKRFDRLDMMGTCIEFIHTRGADILKRSSFEEVQLSTLLMIIDSRSLRCTNYSFIEPTAVLDAVMRWGVAACKRKKIPTDMVNVRKVIEPALRKIRFLDCTKSQFIESMKKWKILTEDEYSAILARIPK